MSLNSKVIMSFLAGTFSAMLAWVVIDFNGFWRISESATSDVFWRLFAQQAPVGIVFGVFVGVAIGFVNGMSSGSGKRLQRDVLWGAMVGMAGGLVGLFLGQLFFGFLYQDPRRPMAFSPLGPLVFIWDVVVRAIGWAFIGTILGLAQGLPSGSAKSARHGAVGGFIGGMLGGTLFEIIPFILPPGTSNPSIISRGISMTVTGAAIGFFIGLVENLMKQAWVRVVQGRNEGREYVISKARTTIGRDELSDVGLYGDRNIAPTHAVIDFQNGRHILRDMGSPLGTNVNGQRVGEDILRDGDIIEIGAMRLEFHEKATASQVIAPVDVAPNPIQIPSMAGICPFCGTKKDANGMCACAVSAQQPGPAAPPSWPGAMPDVPSVSAPTGAGPRLTGTSGPYAGQSFPLPPVGPISVGREPGRSIELPMDTTVSRRHARIENEGGTFVVYDEGSSNGTMVNGMRITRQEIVPGDTVQFGTSAFKFEQ